MDSVRRKNIVLPPLVLSFISQIVENYCPNFGTGKSLRSRVALNKEAGLCLYIEHRIKILFSLNQWRHIPSQPIRLSALVGPTTVRELDSGGPGGQSQRIIFDLLSGLGGLINFGRLLPENWKFLASG